MVIHTCYFATSYLTPITDVEKTTLSASTTELLLKSLCYCGQFEWLIPKEIIQFSDYWCGDVWSRWNICPGEKKLVQKNHHTVWSRGTSGKIVLQHIPSHLSPLCRRHKILSQRQQSRPWRGRERSHWSEIFRLTRATRPIDVSTFR